MATINPLEVVTYERVRAKCTLSECDAHILASTLWCSPAPGVVAAGMLVGALRYGYTQTPCIVEDVSDVHKIWYAGIEEIDATPIIWLVEHSCDIYRTRKRIEFFEWPVRPQKMILFDARCVSFHLGRWIPNSMAAVMMKAKAMDWLKSQPVFSDTELGYSDNVGLTPNPHLIVRRLDE